MNNFKDNVNKKTNEISKKEIGTEGEALKSRQEALNQFQSIQNERRNNLLVQKQSNISDSQQTDIASQAASIGTSTIGTLQKYGMKAPPTIKKSNDIKVAPNKITINNNTTNHIINNTGNNTDNSSKFKTWLNRTLAIQKESANKRNLEYEKRESSLAKSSSKMLSRIESASRSVVDTLNPQKIGTTVGNQLKILLMLFGMRFLSSNWSKIIPYIHNIAEKSANFFKKTADYFGFTENGKKQIKNGGGFYNDLVRFLGGDPKDNKRNTLSKIGSIWIKELGDYLALKFKNMMELRGEAIKSIKFPSLDFSNIGGTLSQLAGYLGNILTALVDPKSAMHSSIRSNINNLGLYSSLQKEKDWRHDTFSKNTDWGDADVNRYKDGKRNYTLNKDYIRSDGELVGTAVSQISQGRDILGAMNQAKETGQLDTARMAAGFQRLQNQVDKKGLITVDPEFISQFYSPSILKELIKNGDIKPKRYKYVKVKRTDQEKSDEEKAHGIAMGAARAYAGSRLGDAVEDVIPVLGNYAANKVVNNGRATNFVSGYANLTEKFTKNIPLIGDMHKGINRGLIMATGAIEGGINNAITNDYTLKLVPAEDNTQGYAVENPSTGKPFFVDMYTLNRNALNNLSRNNFGAEKIDSGDETLLRGVKRKLENFGGEEARTKELFRIHKNDLKVLPGQSEVLYDTADIDRQFENVRSFDNLERIQEAKEEEFKERSTFNKFTDNGIGLLNKGIDYANQGINYARGLAGKFGIGNYTTQANGTWEGATIYGRPPKATDNDFKFDIKKASDEAIQNTKWRLYDSEGKPLSKPYTTKSSTSSTGHCAGYVRRAIAAGLGLNNDKFYSRLKKKNAKDYINQLGQFGFNPLDWRNYTPKLGDILVIGPTKNHPYGHICIKTQRGWVSDFIQSDMWGDRSFRINKEGTIFRHLHIIFNGVDEITNEQDSNYIIEDDYTDTLFDSEGNVVGYKTSDGIMVNVRGDYLNEEEISKVTSSADIKGFRLNQDWSNINQEYDGSSTASNYLTSEDDNKVSTTIISTLSKELGLSPQQAAGIVGNLAIESGLGVRNYKLGQIIDDGGAPAAGLAQWRGPRLENLMKFAEESGKDWGSLDTQIKFLVHELRSKEYSNTLGKLKNSNSADEASYIFGHEFEKFAGYDNPNDENYKKRSLAANAYLKSYDPTNITKYTTDLQGRSNSEKLEELNLRNSSIKEGISNKVVACVGDSWMCGLLGLNTTSVTSTDRSGVKVGNPDNPLFNALKKKGAKDCYGFARSGARIQDCISYVIQVLSINPDIIIVHAGLNNYSDTTENIEKAFIKVLNAAAPVPVFFCAVNYQPSNGKKFFKINRALVDSGVNYLDLKTEGLSYSSDGIHLTNYKSLAELIADKLVEGAPEYKTINIDSGLSIYTSTEKNVDVEESIIPTIDIKTEEEKKNIYNRGDAAVLFENSEKIQKEFNEIGGFKAFEQSFTKLTDEEKDIYKSQKAAEYFWNSLDKNYRTFDFLPEGYKSFENIFIRSNSKERSDLLKNMSLISNYNKQKDSIIKDKLTKEEKNALKIDDYVADNDDNNLMPGKIRWGNDPWKIQLHNWKDSLNDRIVGEEDEINLFNYLRTGNTKEADKLVEKYFNSKESDINKSIEGKGLENKEDYKKELKEFVLGSYNQLKSNLLAPEQFKELNKTLDKLSSEYIRISKNEIDNDFLKDKYGKSLNYSERTKRGLEELETNRYNARKYNAGLEYEKAKFTQQYLSDGLLSTSENNSDLANIKIIEANKKIADLNKRLGELTYFIDSNSIGKSNSIDQKTNKEGKFISDYGGMTDRFQEYMNSKILSGALDDYFEENNIFTEEAVKKYKQREFDKMREESYKLNAEKKYQQLLAEKGKDEADNWKKDTMEAIKDISKNITLTINDYLKYNLEKFNLSTDREGNIVFDTESDKRRITNIAASELIKEGKLNAFAYMQKEGLTGKDHNGEDIVKEEDFTNGNISKNSISLDDNGQLLLNGEKEGDNKDQSSATWRDAMHRDQQLGLMMSDQEYNMKRPVMPKREDFTTLEVINKDGDTYERFDKASYDLSMEDYNKKMALYNSVQQKKQSKEGKLLEASRKELSGRILKEQMDMLRKAGESGFSTTVGQRSIDSDMSNDDNFKKYLETRLGNNTLSDSERAILQTKLSNLGIGETITEVKTTLSNGGSVTRLVDSRGNTIYTMVPEEVKAKRDKGLNSDKLWKQLGFSSEKAKARQDELEAAAVAYKNRQLALQEKGIDAQEAQLIAQAHSYEQINQIFRLAQGEGGGLRVTSDGKNLNEDQKTSDETKQ